jgi:phospholipase/carboxylesterase
VDITTAEFAGLRLTLTLPDRKTEPRQLLVLLHGYGATGDDLVPLAHELGDRVYAFPEAPINLAALPGGAMFQGYPAAPRAWWLIDIERIQLAVAQRQVEQLAAELPAGVVQAGEQLNLMLSELQRELGVGDQQTFLGGFSQGAMLATHVALGSGRSLAGLVVLSGSLLGLGRWLPQMRQRRWPVFVSHGRGDPILPFSLARRLVEELERNAPSDAPAVSFVPFDGQHGIPPIVLTELGRFLEQAAERDARKVDR